MVLLHIPKYKFEIIVTYRNYIKAVYLTFYTKSVVSANTDNAKWKLLLHASVQVKREKQNKHTTAHPTPQARKPSSLHECIIWSVWGPGGVSVSGCSPSQCEA